MFHLFPFMGLYLVMWLFLWLSYLFSFCTVGLTMTFTGYGYSQGQMKHGICLSPTIVGCFCPWHFSVWYPYVIWLWSEVKTAQSRLTLCDPIDYTVHGILRARILSRIAFPFSRGSSQPRDRAGVSCIAGGFFTSWATQEAQLVVLSG